MPPHEEMMQECVRMFTELNRNQAKIEEMVTNHLVHDLEERKALKETIANFNEKIKDLPTIKTYAKIASWITTLVLGAIVVGYIVHIL